MVDIDFDPDEEIADLERQDLEFGDRLRENIEASLSTAAEILRGWLEDCTPRNTGVTAMSWRVMAFDRDDYDITNTNETIITFLTEGTAPHDIYASYGEHGWGVLHWVDDSGADHFAIHVHHPGTPPHDIVGEAFHYADPELEALWDAAVEAAERGTFGD